MRLAVLALALSGAFAAPLYAAPEGAGDRITILYDAFGRRAGLRRDWGFAALIEYQGKRILFDTGDNAAIFEANIRALHVDLRRLDFAVVSHRHGDHTAGLNYLLRVNPRVRIYAPREGFGVFGAALPGTFFRRDSTLPPDQRYFGGDPPDTLRFGTPWPEANFVWVDSTVEVAPGITIVSTVSENPGTLELREISLVLDTSAGRVIVVGCSHPGIEKIVGAAAAAGTHPRLIVGGLHLVTTPDAEIERVALALRERFRLDAIAPGHCTGEPAFALLRRVFADAYRYAGLGEIIPL
ncbi:MAG TPA: MBL fold metallo-hydrolase [Gemmatimonadales bacterium]|nr:MBL fold metallo-hydrolase [Gemmatimonadales bacterium]